MRGEDGELIRVETIKSPILNDQGEVILQESEKRFRAIAFVCLALIVPLKAQAQQAKPRATVRLPPLNSMFCSGVLLTSSKGDRTS